MTNLLLSSIPLSAPRDINLVDILFEWTMDTFGERAPLPEIYILDHTVLETITRQWVGPDRIVWGWYCFSYPNIIFLSSRLNLNTSKFARCTLVHEMVHYLQYHSVKYQHSRPFTSDFLSVLEGEAEHIALECNRLWS